MLRCAATALAAVVLIGGMSPGAWAQDSTAPASNAGARDHGDGFFLRLSAGVGSAATEASDGGVTTRFSGPGVDGNFAIGGIVGSNLALHGTLFGWTIENPDVEIGNADGTATGHLQMGAVGAGVTYYFMPVNIYLSGSIGIGSLEYEQGGFSARSMTGLAFDATVGKEWWVGDGWGIGVAIGLTLHSVPDDDIEDNWSGGSAAVRFTATMN